MEKRCAKCSVLKPINEFPFKSKTKQTYHEECKECHKKAIIKDINRGVKIKREMKDSLYSNTIIDEEELALNNI